jgi:hypothetical protein
VRRSAQDDDFVRGLEIQMVGICRKHEQIEKVTGSQDDVFLGSSKEKHPKQVSAYGEKPLLMLLHCGKGLLV